jgi:hypothetical protein
MQKSFIARTTINFVDFEFYVRSGDLLVYDTTNHRLTVYRNGQIVKAIKQTSLALGAFLKNRFIEELAPTAASPVVEAPMALPVASDAPVSLPEPRKPAPKRDKAPQVSTPLPTRDDDYTKPEEEK